MGRKLFCDINPTCYKISIKKEYLIRDLKDFFSLDKISMTFNNKLPYLIKGHFSLIFRKLHGVSDELQINKKINIELACNKINGIVIKHGEVFSFWKLVGNPNYKNGYVDGLTIGREGFLPGPGGGLCQMANMIHYLVLNSDLDVTEIHHHTDALFPDDRRRVPFGTGTSVFYKNVDYRFKNNTNHDVQICVWVEGDYLKGELRSTKELRYRYKLIEEGHHFKKENDKFYRNSKVYKIKIDKVLNKKINKELILDNHSVVMYDYSLIPRDEIHD